MQIYSQPRRRQIYRPLTKTCPGTAVEGWGKSTYRLSYKKPERQSNDRLTTAPSEGLWPEQTGREQFDRLTVHRASFPVWPDADRALPTVPCDHELVGGTQDRMQAVTSQRHDFVTKCLPEDERHRATGRPETIGTNCGSGSCAMTSTTTTGDAYAPTAGDGRRLSARPSTAASWSRDPNLLMARDTETSSSYQRWGPLALSRPRAAAAYCRAPGPVNDRTVYRVSYRPPGSFRDPLPGEQPPDNGYGNVDDVPQDRPFYPRAHDYNL